MLAVGHSAEVTRGPGRLSYARGRRRRERRKSARRTRLVTAAAARTDGADFVIIWRISPLALPAPVRQGMSASARATPSNRRPRRWRTVLSHRGRHGDVAKYLYYNIRIEDAKLHVHLARRVWHGARGSGRNSSISSCDFFSALTHSPTHQPPRFDRYII